MCYGTPNDLYSAHLQGTDPDSRYLPYSFILSMRGYNNWNIARKCSVSSTDISWYSSPFYAMSLLVLPLLQVHPRLALCLSAQLHSRLICPLTLYATSGRGWASTDGRQRHCQGSHSHSPTLMLQVTLSPAGVLQANKQINGKTTTMAEKQKQATKRVKGFLYCEKSLMLGVPGVATLETQPNARERVWYALHTAHDLIIRPESSLRPECIKRNMHKVGSGLEKHQISVYLFCFLF